MEGASVEPQEYILSSANNVDFIGDGFEDLPEDLFLQHPAGGIHTLKVHRGRIFEELLEAFEQNIFNDTVRIEMILPNGEIEYAEDFGGVFRDALSEFWFTFYEKCTIGTTLKIPYLRHDFGEVQWRSIAKIFIKGFEIEKYIPIKLAPVFIQSCFGQNIEDDDEILDNFLQYMCESEADVIKQALKNFGEVDNDELLDVLTSYATKWAPTKNNFKQLIRDIAHTELVQKPAFVVKCFGLEFKNNMNKISAMEVAHLYKALKPSVKNCLAKIDIQNEQEITPERTKVYSYLKRFIKEADEKTRTGFFRFCTGSDLPIRNIAVTFIGTLGIGRVPIAHTCTGLLELPEKYENFVFRSELNNILSSNIWIMDII
ncbi:hypothetical protein NQ314_011324 [Rhamnusium bicolor]|uniref:HECT domain-containing protein n=1 Tax=Rhamnusium bicolor TaxID=1586634 RepID=A0AAV8XII2_9CUCU|nr:hypothetical protein NQ314_011324 [Rhamnusium bicolor]